ncbi:MAG: 30S ribosomal protein S12 methylthiotransferase RimO [Armatimonadota bacterium]|nr:30S ribosomal protein S12 methylthiotransferase RimO [Armatimonadota bacterium]MCX7776878.1 30S ribosomal protein S12 methylthiotransferase RimO [Armatimonadota bacterium]MDW8024436.1 30S ribosomal protein S12 methylthiotransferase RimO [Armatimonadota bacterium]
MIEKERKRNASNSALHGAFHGRLPKCIVVSLGCPKNTVDSERLLAELLRHGYSLTTNAEDADVIIVNTCGFIKAAVEESLDVLRRLSRYKRNGRARSLIAAGCLCSRAPELIKRFVPQVDACLPVDKLLEIPRVIRSLNGAVTYDKCSKLRDDKDGVRKEPFGARLLSTPSWYSYLKLAEGCDRSCSFCVIPMIRGSQSSRKLEEIEAEAMWLASVGVKELILVAQETTRYGFDLYGKLMLPKLLRQLVKIEGIHWVRILYGFPTTVTDELIETMAALVKVVRYIDVPFQHVHPEILRAMRRPGDAESYLRLIERLRSAMPDIAIRTTFIVGFPGESEAHFEMLLEFVREAKLDRVGAFTFSPEPETDAAKFDGQVPDEVKLERYKRLMELQSYISFERNRQFIGKEIEVLIESWSEHKGAWVGRSYRDAPEIDGAVYVSGDGLKPGEFAKVIVEGSDEYDLFAKLSQR